MNRQIPLRFRLIACGLFSVLGMASIATRADGRAQSVPLLPKYQQECSSCHVAYPPDMLPAASWQRLMNGLPQHFGADASLDSESVKQISTWLAQHAGTGTRVATSPPEDRITRSTWFIKEHHEVSAATWKLPAVKSASNCAACHTRAEQGDFSERFVRIPR